MARLPEAESKQLEMDRETIVRWITGPPPRGELSQAARAVRLSPQQLRVVISQAEEGARSRHFSAIAEWIRTVSGTTATPHDLIDIVVTRSPESIVEVSKVVQALVDLGLPMTRAHAAVRRYLPIQLAFNGESSDMVVGYELVEVA